MRDYEAQRLDALADYQVLDTPPDEAFDRITRIAQNALGFPIALISLVDRDRQFFKSHLGLDACETSLDVSFCKYAIASEQTLIVPDAHADVRFQNNALVTGVPNIRAYWGTPLKNPGGFAIGSLCVIDTRCRWPDPKQITLLEDLARLTIDQLELRLVATTDSLTGAKTRRAFYASANRQFARAKKTGEPLSVVVLDLDHFKRLNDRHGHAFGDEVLRRAVRAVRGVIRRSDIIGRLGGEEFAVLLPKTPVETAIQMAHRIRQATLSISLVAAGSEVAVTTSCGVATMIPHDQSAATIVKRADHALYEAKSAGRNTVRSANRMDADATAG